MYKIYTNIITKRLSKVFNKHILNKSQLGFRKGMSPQSALRCLTNIIEEANYSQKELHLTHIDCKKAFDSIHQDAIFEALEVYGVGEHMLQVIQELYQDCSAHLKINNHKGTDFPIGRGVRQGDTLSPLLFIITVNGLLDWIEANPEGYTMMQGLKLGIIAYCDDMVLIAPNKRDTKILFNKLKEFCQWAIQLRMDLIWEDQMTYLEKKFKLFQNLILHRHLNTNQKIYISNIVSNTYITYSMAVIHYDSKWLAKLDKITNTTINHSMGLKANSNTKPLYATTKEGGKGLISLIDLQEATTCAQTIKELNSTTLSALSTNNMWYKNPVLEGPSMTRWKSALHKNAITIKPKSMDLSIIGHNQHTETLAR
jgi:hypothetical protein